MREPAPRHRWRLTTLLLAGVVALVAGAGVVGSVIWNGPQAPATAPPASRPAPAPQEPVTVPVHEPAGQPPGTIRLPEGGTAKLVRQELDATGTLPVPDGVEEATWWGAGLDAPTGATVLAGHVNWKGSVGPFAELWRAEPAQAVTVVDDAGQSWEYEVSEVLTLDKDELPQQAANLFGQGGDHRLVLVTCGGEYVGGQTGYEENRIVVATPAT